MEKSEEEYFPGPNQEGGGEEADGAGDDRRHLYLREEEKHQDLQRDSGGQVGQIHTNSMFHLYSAKKNTKQYYYHGKLGLSQRTEFNVHSNSCWWAQR